MTYIYPMGNAVHVGHDQRRSGCPKTALSENLVHPSERTVEPF